MKKALPNLATLKIHQIGLKRMNWLIAKDDNEQPTARRRSGVILARDAADDHPFCWLYYIDVVEDFAGGKDGHCYGKLTTKKLIGCPLNAK